MRLLVMLTVLLVVKVATAAQQEQLSAVDDISRSSFPKGFIFGTASSAYQYEGAVKEGGRGVSIWDTVSHIPGNTWNDSTGDIACDSYYKYEEDIDLMADMTLDAYRFSIAWPRLFPEGNESTVNQAGVDYYNHLIDGLLKRGIEPWVTLYHWDLPQSLMNRLGGWSNPKIVDYFEVYAEACFVHFGDRVKHWITFNEPATFLSVGINWGCINASGNQSTDCGLGNSSTIQYLAAHNVLLSHAVAVKTYRDNFQAKQEGHIGITIDVQWFEALSNSSSDIKAADEAMTFRSAWFLDPLYFGDYPVLMREALGDWLPTFSKAESEMVKQSLDFLGLNHYTSYYVTGNSNVEGFFPFPFITPEKVEIYMGVVRDGIQIGPVAGSFWLYIVPSGMEHVLNWVKNRYDNPLVYITENGVDEASNQSLPLVKALQDPIRIQFYHDYLSHALAAIRNGANVRGYFAWSLLDNFEWLAGYSVRFGLHFVDFANNQARYPKTSVSWFKKFLLDSFPIPTPSPSPSWVTGN